MNLTYLGTAASEGWPAFFCQCPLCRQAARAGGRDIRYRTCALLDGDVLLDASPDLYAAKVRHRIDLGRVRHVLFTHSHSDHFALAQLCWYGPNFAPEIADRQPMRLYGSEGTHRAYQATMALVGSRYIDGWMDFHPLTPYETTAVGDMLVTLLPARHGAEGASVYCIERGGRRLLYLHDTGGLDEAVFDWLRGRRADIISMDATGGPTPAGEASGHMSLPQDIALRDRLADIGVVDAQTRCLASHICIHGCHRDGKPFFAADMEAMMAPHGFTVAYDGLTVTV